MISYVCELIYTQLTGCPPTKRNKTDRNFIRITVTRDIQSWESTGFNYTALSTHLRNEVEFDPSVFNIQFPFEDWLDLVLHIPMEVHVFDPKDATKFFAVQDGNIARYYGSEFPITPTVDREGFIYSSMYAHLLKRVIEKRKNLISESNYFFQIEWLFELRSLIGDSISMIESFLNQLYLKSQYSPLQHWREFDIRKMGERHNTRFKDKTKWAYLISGNPLNDEAIFPEVDNLRKVRNHLVHMDPPTVAVAAEEVATWLNQIIDVGLLMIKIRQSLGLKISEELINFVLQKEVLFNPEERFSLRAPLDIRKANYQSSVWPNETA